MSEQQNNSSEAKQPEEQKTEAKGFMGFIKNMFTRPMEEATEMAEKTVGTMGNIANKAIDTVGDTATAMGEIAGKAVDSMGEMAGKAANAMGEVAEIAADTVGETATTVGNMAGKAINTTGSLISGGLESLSNTLVNTSKFMMNSKYRREEVYPWLQAILRDNWAKVSQEIDESQEMMMVLWKYSRGYTLTEEEKNAAKEQLYDLMKVFPALAIFALPGGAILLPLIARAIPWDLTPSAFREKVKEEYGEDALDPNLKPDEEIPVDKEATVPEEIKKEAEENLQKLAEEGHLAENSIEEVTGHSSESEIASAEDNKPETANTENNKPPTDQA